MIRVMLCDDHAMLRRGIRDTLAEAVDIQVTAEAGSYPELREALRNSPCDVLLLDLNMPGRGDPEDLIKAVRTVMEGRKHLTPEVAQLLADSLSRPAHEAPHATLSERELQTLLKIASGKRLSDIAEELMLSPKTVSVYRTRVLEKLSLSNNAELTVYAIRNNLV